MKYVLSNFKQLIKNVNFLKKEKNSFLGLFFAATVFDSFHYVVIVG